MSAEEWAKVNSDYAFRKDLHAGCQALLHDAYGKDDRSALACLHEVLGLIYDQDFSATTLGRVDCETQPVLRDIAATLEHGMLEHEKKMTSEEAISSYPSRGAEYVGWLKRLISSHRCSKHPFYNSFLAERATAADLRFFLAQETSLDPRFDDILAFLQVGLQGGAKMEIANNYHDEMGNGRPEVVHAYLFKKALDELNIDDAYVRDSMILDARISGNISACLALSRRHYYKAIGYFGVTEYLMPRRAKFFVTAWRRNGLSEVGMAYHDLHIHIDAAHARGWFDNVIVPLIDRDPGIGREIALGSVIRLNSSSRYLDALLACLEPRRKIGPMA